MEKEVYPNILRWRDRVVPLSWYELVLEPEKLRIHLKVLEGDLQKEPTPPQLITTFLEKGGAIEGQPPLQDAAAVFLSDATSLKHTDLLSQKSELLIRHALFVAGFFGWNLPLLEGGLSPVVQYSLFLALKRLHGADEEAATALYHHWIVRYYSTFDLPVKPNKLGSDSQQFANAQKIADLVCQEVAVAKGNLREMCLRWRGTTWPDVSLPHLALHADQLQAQSRVAQMWYDLGQACFKDEEYVEALDAFGKSKELLSQNPKSEVLFAEGDLLAVMAACQSILPVTGKVLNQQCLFTRVEVAWKERRLNDLLSLLVSDTVEGQVPGWFREQLMSESAQLELRGTAVDNTDQREAKRSRKASGGPPRRSSLDAGREDMEEGSSVLRVKLQMCDTLYRLLQGEPSTWRWHSALRTARREQVEAAAEILLRWRETISESPLEEDHLQSVCGVVRLVSVSVAQHNFALAQKVESAFDLPEVSKNSEAPAPLGGTPTPSELIAVLVAQGNSTYSESAEGKAMNIISAEKDLLLARTAKEVVQYVGRLYELLPLDQVESYAAKFESSGAGFASSSLIPDPILRTKYNVLISKATHIGTARPSVQTHRRRLDLYRAAVKLLDSQSSVSQAAKAARVPFLQEKILAMELGHANTVWTDDVMNKFPVLVEKAKAYLKQSQSGDEFDGRTIQSASAFLLNAREYAFLSSLVQPFKPGKVAPRLACALTTLQEKGYMRKPTRDLFEAVLSLFSSGDILPANEVRDIKSSFEVLVANIKNQESLSLLLSALAKLWHMVQRPSSEVSCEFNSHWPTAIGSQNVQGDQVLRVLSSTLQHALEQFPQRGEWMVIQGDLYFAQENYSSALKQYLEAGSVTSAHFTQEVPSGVWTAQVYQRMLACCTAVQLPTHAIVLCQYWEPVDYELAFTLIRDSDIDNIDLLSECLSDMTLIEYLIYQYNRQGDNFRRSHMVRLAGQPQLNVSNSRDILEHARQLRRKRFFIELFALTHQM